MDEKTPMRGRLERKARPARSANGPIDQELAPLARSDERAKLLQTIPGVGPLIGLTFASEIGDVSRFSSASKLVGYAANQAWRPTNPFHSHYRRLAARQGTNPAKVSVARKLLISSWHMLSRGQVFRPPHPTTAPASSPRFQAA